MTSVLLVDDHHIVRLAVRMLLERERFTVVGETGKGKEAARIHISPPTRLWLRQLSLVWV